MPLFFLLSGLNVNRSLSKGKICFIQEKLWLIAYPYILWSLIQGTVQIAFSSYINSPPTAIDLLSILWAPIGQFWFLYALFFCHMLALAFGSRRAILAVIALLIVAHFIVYEPIVQTLTFRIEYMIPFYVLGVFLGTRMFKMSIKPKWLGLVCTVSAATYALAVSWGNIASHQTEYAVASVPACLAGIIGVIAVSQFIEHYTKSVAKCLAGIGTVSMTIYILHILAGAGTRVILTRLGIGSVALDLTLGTIMGVALPILMHQVFKHYRLLTAFGLAPLSHSSKVVEPLSRLGDMRSMEG
jgi:fucose 4-O-acetylase-like acetyltransferase